MVDASVNAPRAIALIDLLDLEWQIEKVGLVDDGLFALEGKVSASSGPRTAMLESVVERLEAGASRLAATPPGVGPAFAAVHVYAPLEAARSLGSAPPLTRVLSEDEKETTELGGMILKAREVAVDSACWSCSGPCTHCKGGNADSGIGLGRDNPMHADLLRLAHEDAYDWAVVVSADLLLIPLIRYLQAHGRRIVHGCFPPLAMDLTAECWASIDLSSHGRTAD